MAHSESTNKKTNRAYLITGIATVVLLACYFIFLALTHNQESTDDAFTEADVVPLAFQVPGRLMHLYVQDHQKVKKGELIAELDPTDYKIKVELANSELTAALANAENSTQPTSKDARENLARIEVARSGLAQAQSQFQKAESDYKRADELRRQKAISPVEFDEFQNNYNKAKAAVDEYSAQLRVAHEMHSAAEAKVQSAQADLDFANTQLGYTKIYAPQDGKLSILAVREGQLVTAGQLVAQLVSNVFYIIANFKETQVGRMQIGQAAKFKIDSYPGMSFTGKIASVSPATGSRFSLIPPDNASGNFVKVVERVPVKIEWTNQPQDLNVEAGLSTDLTVYLN